MHSTAWPEDEQVREPVTGESPAEELLKTSIGVQPAGGRIAPNLPTTLPTIEQLLIEAAIQRPEVDALIGVFGSLTYADLLIRAQNIAAALRRRGILPGQFVGVAMDQSEVTITSIVGILLAGAAYVPLGRDLLMDAEVLKSIRSAGMALILCDRSHGTGSCILWGQFGSVLDASRLEQQTMPTSDETGIPSTTQNSPAAVLFRRLPGGEAASVVVPHRAITRLVSGKRLMRFHSMETFLLHPSTSLRPALFELWGCLLSGATLALAPDGPIQPPRGPLLVDQMALNIRQFGVSTLCLPVSALHDLIDLAPSVFPRLNNLVIELEHDGKVSTLSPQKLQWLAGNHPRLRIVNTYGSVETSGYALSYTVPQVYQAQASVPVGRPIDGMQAQILDRELFPSREGEIGQLALSGDGVVSGYLNNPDATARRFLRQPEMSGEAYLFLTGERARWRSDGMLELHGPSFSHATQSAWPAELGAQGHGSGQGFGSADIEAMLMSQQGIRDAAVVEQLDEQGLRRHIAFVALDPSNALFYDMRPTLLGTGPSPGDADGRENSPAQSGLEQSMRSVLPLAAMPSVFRYVESIPRNVEGKPDEALLEQQWAIEKDRAEHRQRLEKQRQSVQEQGQETLNQVRTIWLRLLQRVSVGCDEDFMEAGGTQVQMIRMHVELNRLFPGAITMANLSVLTTIRRIHQHLLDHLKHSAPKLNRRGA